MSSPPWILGQPNIRFDLIELLTASNTTDHFHIETLLNEYPDYTLCLTDGSKLKNKTAYAYSISGTIPSHRIRNTASVFAAELMAIFSCLSHLTQLSPNSGFLLTDSLSPLHALLKTSTMNPLDQRTQLTRSMCKLEYLLDTFQKFSHIDLIILSCKDNYNM